MGSARIAGVAFAIICVTLRAQSPSKLTLKIMVTDRTGVAISRAEVQTRASDSRITSQTWTDTHGEALLSLDPDTSTISVRASGFDHWQYRIDTRKSVDKPLIAVLRIQSYYGPTLVNADPVLETEPQPPIVIEIPLEPLEFLVDLPRHELRWFPRSHHPAS
jgi:hypothetical protein